ncbi:hypothetical protein AAHK07_09320 [Aliarcobacter cryaerophilus]|uniref:hypothetical protein n=1 Tax=Aliarcobacter cryaerophilus TaxID=28198 RepID=UPI00317D1C9D
MYAPIIESIIYNFFCIIISSGIIAFIIKNFIKTKIEQSIKHAYDKKLEEFKQEQLIRYKAEVVAELIAEWISNPADNKRLHQLTFEAFLWLPDDICHELSKRLCNEDNAIPYKEILIATRKHLLKETNLKAAEIVHFPEIDKGEK